MDLGMIDLDNVYSSQFKNGQIVFPILKKKKFWAQKM